MNNFAEIAHSLAVLATLALLEFFGLRGPIRDGLARLWGWLRAKVMALRSEVRAFVAWVFQPDDFDSESAAVRLAGFRSTFSTLAPEERHAVIEAERRWADLDRACPDVDPPAPPCNGLHADENGWCWHGDEAHPVEEPFQRYRKPRPKPEEIAAKLARQPSAPTPAPKVRRRKGRTKT